MAKRFVITPQGELREIETDTDSQALAQAMAMFNESRRSDAEILTQAAVRGLHLADTSHKLAGQQRENRMEQLRYALSQRELARDNVSRNKDTKRIHTQLGLIKELLAYLNKE